MTDHPPSQVMANNKKKHSNSCGPDLLEMDLKVCPTTTTT